MNCDCPRVPKDLILHFEKCPLHEKRRCPICADADHSGNELQILRDQVKALEQLKRYAYHLPACAQHDDIDGPCGCGYAEALFVCREVKP